jgi:serine/threonine protein kinase
MVAKAIIHIEGNEDLGPEQSDRAFAIEKGVLEHLPAWWNLRLIHAFRNETMRVIVTPELPTSSWLLYQPSVASDKATAQSLERQLRWLHDEGIQHTDLELKNVMLTPEGPVIIDFEKARPAKTLADKVQDWKKLISSLREKENTRRIGDLLEARMPGRRKSIGGTRRRRRLGFGIRCRK